MTFPTKYRKQWLAAFCMLMAAIVFTACSANYGRISSDPAVTSLFQYPMSGSAYRFYFDGREGLPYAIIGIKTGYSFKSKYWTEVDPQTPRFKTLVERVYRTDGEPVNSGWINGPNGSRVGIWYSLYRQTIVQVDQDKRVLVYSPYTPSGRDHINQHLP